MQIKSMILAAGRQFQFPLDIISCINAEQGLHPVISPSVAGFLLGLRNKTVSNQSQSKAAGLQLQGFEYGGG